jgi:thioredoxin-like negative regulator of GroEL
MPARFTLICIVLGFLVAAPAFAEEINGEAAARFAEGEQLLEKGDLDGALKAYMAAAKADPENKAYIQQAMVLKRVKALRGYVDTNDPSPKWEKMVLSLHVFYLTHNMSGEALALDRMAFGKQDSALNASLLAETLLDLKKNEEAYTLLTDLDKEKLDEQNRLYLGITYARLERIDEARKLRDGLNITRQAKPGLLYDCARLNTLVGDHARALDQLKLMFEKTPPSQLDKNKNFVQACSDFTALKRVEGFSAVMSTLSKVAESSCSGGTSCGSCPNRSSCGSGAAADKDACGDCGDKNSSECKDCDKK